MFHLLSRVPQIQYFSSRFFSSSLTAVPTFKYIDQLSHYLAKNFILHEPGKFLIILKPYGISCVGERQENGGVFKSSKHDNKSKPIEKKKMEHDLTIVECIPNLANMFREPNLQFSVGLKRYLSGAIVLPANEKEADKLRNSVKMASLMSSTEDFHYRALTLLMGSPPSKEGTLTGYSTFIPVGKHKEYVFVEGKAKRRAKSGSFAVEGTMNYRVLSRKHGCSLVEFEINKFARHLPRLMFSHMLCPILGDKMYMNRLVEVDGRPVLLNPSKQSRNVNLWFPPSLSKQVGIHPEQLRQSLPLYCHVYTTIFPRYGWVSGLPRSQQDVTDLVSSAPPPAHFLSMVKALEMEKELFKFFQENEPQNSEIGGDLSF